MPILTQSIDVSTPIQIAYNRIAQLENFAQFLPTVLQVAPLPSNDLVIDSQARFEVQLYERIPYTQIAWRCSDSRHSGRLGLSLIREMPNKACRIHFELEYTRDLLNEEGQRSLSHQVEASLQSLKRFLENRS